jgi:hypothetical protein
MAVLFLIVTLFWQLLVLFVCCSGVGLILRFLLPKEFSLLDKVLFSLLGGLFLVVLIPQNLFYLGVPVRISAWLLLGAALWQMWLCRQKFVVWVQAFSSNYEIRSLLVVILLTITFHGIVPIQQGLGWYYGKGYVDQRNYVLLAEFLKEEPYSTSANDIGLRPWLVDSVLDFKGRRIGQSIITAEISVWSGTSAKEGYAATVIFFLTLLAIALYVLLREIGTDPIMAMCGALLAAVLPVVTRLALNGYLSQISILFVFPFFTSLLRHEELSARKFTLFFSLTLAYLVAAYSEIAPIGVCTLILGVMFVRHDTFRAKRLMLMSAILITTLMNPFYLRNLIGFLAEKYGIAAGATSMGQLMPNVLTLRGWSELIFGVMTGPPFALFFNACSLLLGFLVLVGAVMLSKRDRMRFGAILLPAVLVSLYLATRSPPLYYPSVKITLTILPFVIGLMFVALSRISANDDDRLIGLLKKVFAASIVTAAAAGSVRYYSGVLNNEGLLSDVRDAHFQNVCHELEAMKNRRVLVFEIDPLLTPWLCYHARHNNVYFDNRPFIDAPVAAFSRFAKIPDLASLDFVATRDRIVDLRGPKASSPNLVVNPLSLEWGDGHLRSWIGQSTDSHFLSRPISAGLKMRLPPRSEATILPVDFLRADDPNHVYEGVIWGRNVDLRRMNFPKGFSTSRFLVTPKGGDSNGGASFSVLAELDGI